MASRTPKISVMTLTNRPGGIDITWASLKKQTFQDFEWVLIDGVDRQKEVEEYVNDPRLKWVKQNEKPKGALTNLAHADNQGFRECSGELIVCLQDYIWVNPEGLQKYWDAYQSDKTGLVSGVGHQYLHPSKDDIHNPQGLITVFNKPYTRKPETVVWEDPRMRDDNGSFYVCNAPSWEMNWASIPRSVVYELGGMDEQYDYEGFAWDNVNIAQRAEMLGYKCYMDQSNVCMGFQHDDWWPNPLKVERKSPAEYHFKVINEMAQGIQPVKLNYLD